MRSIILFCALLIPGMSCGDDRQQVIDGVKSLENRLGFEQTHNFLKESGQKAYYRCYYTGKLELPESYEQLGYKRGSETGCDVDTSRYDLFFYAVQAVGSGKTPVTSSLAEAPVERLLVVVPHEDFHQVAGRSKLPPAVPESAATLVGFLTASEFARQQYGPESATYKKLLKDPEIFLEKSAIVNAYAEKLRALYGAVKAGQVSEQEALAGKDVLFRELKDRCGGLRPDPGSFNKCLAVNNNAGLAFDVTYTKYYPLMYSVYTALGRDLNATVDTLKRVLSNDSYTERQALSDLESVAGRGPACTLP